MYRFVFIFWLGIAQLHAQPFQTLKGTITDKASGSPLAAADVVVSATVPELKAVSDSNGFFVIQKVPLGRYDLRVILQGYEELVVREIQLTAARQTELNISLTELSRTFGKVTVTAGTNKEQALNGMAMVSARTLSVEEAKRYAGGFDDPARLASAFAGVAGSSGVNGIIVRGNAPKYLQWKMEGVEIPNPNHFGDMKAFGGGILTGLSSQMLANSDFFTGAFPAEYNNALSGVFDISMRKGNTQKRENTLQFGLIGVETSSEGPFLKGKKSSYLFNYRNSTLALLEPLLPENADKIKYQDLSFKLNFPTSKAGTFTLWGLGLKDGARANAKTDSMEWKYKDSRQRNDISLRSGSLGIGHRIYTNASTYIKTSLVATGQKVLWEAQSLNSRLDLKPYSEISNLSTNLIVSSFINQKISSRHSNRTGILLTGMDYRLKLGQALGADTVLSRLVDAKGFNTLMSAYSSSQFSLSPRVQMTLGINAQYFTLNRRRTIEPRMGLKIALNNQQSVGLAYGLHSRIENLYYYYNKSLRTGEEAVNKHMDFTRAHHGVLSYNRRLGKNIHLRAEAYYQYLFDVPVIADSSFSFINMQSDWFFAEKLENTGAGKNAGIDVTLEKYISKGFYYLLTASVFDSRYRGGDGVWRNSRYNRTYVFNLLAGKEWKVGSTKQNSLSVNARVVFQGGNRYSPVDELASRQMKEVVYDESKAFSLQSAPITNFHFTLTYRKNNPKSSRELSFKVINLNAQPDFYGYKYNYRTNTTEKDLSSVVLPNLSYKIEF